MKQTPKLDAKALHACLDQRRQALGISWREAAKLIGVGCSTLTRMGQGKHPSVDCYLSMMDWLWGEEPKLPAQNERLTIEFAAWLQRFRELEGRVSLLERRT